MTTTTEMFWENCVVRDETGREYLVAGTPRNHVRMDDGVPVYVLIERRYHANAKTWILSQEAAESGRLTLVNGGPYEAHYRKDLP